MTLRYYLRRGRERRRDDDERRIADPVVEIPTGDLRALDSEVVDRHQQREERALRVRGAGLGREVEERELDDHAQAAKRDIDDHRRLPVVVEQVGERADDADADRPLDEAPERVAT